MRRAAWLALAAAFLAAGPVPARAEEPDDEDRVEQRSEKGGRPDGLTDAQKESLKKARRSYRDATTPLRDKKQDLLAELRKQVKDQADDKAVGATLDKLDKVRDSLDSERKKFHDKVQSILTPSQRAAKLVGRGGHGGFGGKRGGCGRR